jgi:hypothetical protein
MYSPVTQERPLSSAMVVSHHCEWTKARKAWAAGRDWPVLLAPVYELAEALQSNEQRLVRDGKIRYWLYLPADGPVDRELFVDLRLIQPYSSAELDRQQSDCYWASVGLELNRALRAKIIEYLYRDFTAKEQA